ncbi:MAG: hypothetical protein V4864_07065 [Pseudomonadota bacterium]
MKKTLLSCSLLAALLGAGAVQAAPTSDVPLQAGEASTMTGGVPNAKTTNSPYPDGTPVVVVPGYSYSPTYGAVVSSPVATGVLVQPVEPVRPSARQLSSASVTSDVPTRAGEASTMTNGAPNLVTSNVQSAQTTYYVAPYVITY